MKMYCKIKRPDNARENIEEGETIVVQEKIDGSNTAIYNDNGKLRLYSRSQELIGEDGLSGFVKYIRAREDKILTNLPAGYVLYGEWLGQGKIGYNSEAKKGNIEPYYAFDIASKITSKQIEDDDFEREFVDVNTVIQIVNECGFKNVPELGFEKFINYDYLKNKYVNNKQSMLGDYMREGIVIKTMDGKKRIKIVGDSFQEVKVKKNSTTKSPYAFLDKYITPARIYKFLEKISLTSPTKEDYKEIFKSLDIIADDIIEEEKDLILQDLNRIIKKQAVDNIKLYLEPKPEKV